MSLHNKDLNLLLVFEALFEELNTSRAAKRLHVTQPALSNALARLRKEWGDDLFVRSGKGMAATPKAIALREGVLSSIHTLRQLYEGEVFNPKTCSEKFRIASTDYLEHLLLPGLLPILSKDAPNVITIMRETHGALPKAEFESGSIDLAVAGFYGDLPEGYYQEVLFQESYSCLVRKNHPRIKNILTLEDYLGAEHILASPQGDLNGVVDRELKAMGRKRKVIAGLANFHTLAPIVANSDFIVTLPRKLARLLAPVYHLKIFEPPIKVPPYNLVQVWHARTNGSPAHQWYRATIRGVLESQPHGKTQS